MDFEIGELHPNSPHLFGDLAELLLLTNYFGKDRLHKNDLESVLTKGTISHEEIDANEDEDAVQETDAERNSRVDRQLEDVMAHLEYRARSFGDSYPFIVRKEELEVITDLNEKQRVYRALLACSRLRSFKKTGVPQRWARTFTAISKQALTALMPSHATVRIFDANSDDRRNYYSTDLREALRKLGKDLSVMRVLAEECDKHGAAGDAGLDLVGLVDFGDGATHSYAIVGQCGAQETGWPKKTLEGHSLRFRHCFHTLVEVPSFMFTPVCYRSTTGEWKDSQSATGIFLADRGRILKLVNLEEKARQVVGEQWFERFEQEFAEAGPPQ